MKVKMREKKNQNVNMLKCDSNAQLTNQPHLRTDRLIYTRLN